MPLTLTKRRNQGQTFERQSFVNLDLSSMLAFGSKWIDCTFDNCDLTLADMTSNTITACRLSNCDLRLSNFRGSIISDTTFHKCNLRQAVFAGVHPLDTDAFFDCQMQYSTFYDSTVKGLQFLGCNLHGADLRFIENTGCLFNDCVLWNAAVTFGCQFFGSQNMFDERAANQFAAILSQVHPNLEKRRMLRELAGKEMALVDRLMAPTKEEAEVSNLV